MPWLNCLKCTKIFYAKPRHIKIGWGKFCSPICSYSAMKTGEYFACEICTKKIYRTKLDIQRSKSKKFFCNKSCFAIWKNENVLRGDKNGNWKDGENAYRSMMLRHKTEPICSDCGISNLKVLVVHHLDQNRKNNIISNLRWLCRNCHYLVHKGKTL
jgi:hypothetical protein